MAIRLTIDGVPVECDTPQEAALLIRTVRPSEKHIMQVQGHYAKAAKDPFSSTASPRALKGFYGEVLSAMKETFPNNVSSQTIAARIGKTLRSLPIILVGLQNHAKKNNMKFDELIVRSDPPMGEKGSSYRLTDKGLKVFFG